MKSIRDDLMKNVAIFKQNCYQYILLICGIDLLNQFIIIPTFRFITTYVLQASAVPLDSLRNLITIITTRPLFFLVLVLEFISIVVIFYYEFAFGFVFSENLIQHRQLTVKNILANIPVTLGSVSLFLLYLLLFLPLFEIIFRTEFLSKIKLAEYIISHIETSLYFGLFVLVVYLVFFMWGSRLLLVLPLMWIKKLNFKNAVKQSWQAQTRKVFKQVMALLGVMFILMTAIYLLIYVFQSVLDLFPGKYFGAIFNLTLLQIISEFALIWTLENIILIVSADKASLSVKKVSQKRYIYVLDCIITLLFLSTLVGISSLYLKTSFHYPLIISHRGVNDKNGVQNTLQSLKKTAKLKPDYVEIDVHETKDHHLVVMHDENLKKLTNVNQPPSALTLKQITKLTAHENNHKAKLVSFAQYLKTAEDLHQKLLIEIKTTPSDSKEILPTFARLYGRRLIKNGDQVQSLDYRVITSLKKLSPKLTVFYLEPYNLSYPRSKADGYAVEYAALTDDFIRQAHAQAKPVYAWTINYRPDFRKMINEPVDGVITDRVTYARKLFNHYQKEDSLAKRILRYALIY